MHKERIKASIEQMKRVDGLDMCTFQSDVLVVESESELHLCGNEACWAGYTAIADFFKRDGGRVNRVTGAPEFGGLSEDLAMARYFGISKELAKAIVFGNQDDLVGIQGLALWTEGTGDKEPEVGFPRIITNSAWMNAKPEHIIEILESVLDGTVA